uniref:Eukaryotic translation initiation factor 3 subunit A n=3 Tax=Zeugodacus cucurbitae TaxID=28588 RepID=A0A0A1XQ65_ZEUCU
MAYGLNWGIAYDLPNASWVLNQLHGLSQRPRPMSAHHRRSKRTIYERIAETVDNMGYNGRNCVLRALCESRQYFARTKMGMIGEILRVIFSLPKQRIFSRELQDNSDIVDYDHAYRKARSLDCVAQYDCPFSLLELAFGKYLIPPVDYYGNSGM